MTTQPDYLMLDRYLAGECSPADRERVERWLAEDQARLQLVGWMREVKAAAAELPGPWNADELWRGVEERLAGSGRERQAVAPRFLGLPEPKRIWSTRLMRIAAVVALVLGGTALWQLAMRSGARSTVEAVAMRTFTTRPGERAGFNLVDGSRVTLGASSSLDVPDTYGRRTRDVYLQGQGYFEVVPDPTKPFRVHSTRAVTEVLGTKFDVRAYPDDSTVSVAVAEGTVAVAAPDSGAAGRAVLTRGDLARLSSRGGVQVERGIDLGQYLAWTEGRLVFVNVLLREVIPQLERWYDLEIRLADSALARLPLTASLGTESAPEMLRLLELSLDVRVARQGRVVTLSRSRGSH